MRDLIKSYTAGIAGCNRVPPVALSSARTVNTAETVQDMNMAAMTAPSDGIVAKSRSDFVCG